MDPIFLGRVFNLRKRNVVVISDVARGRRVRSPLITLIHCEVARELWSSILNLFGVDWVMPR
jgi:hypothetical protein